MLEVQSDLMRGEDGTAKPLSCSASLLARLVKQRPRDLSGVERVLGDKRADRFGDAFLEVLREA